MILIGIIILALLYGSFLKGEKRDLYFAKFRKVSSFIILVGAGFYIGLSSESAIGLFLNTLGGYCIYYFIYTNDDVAGTNNYKQSQNIIRVENAKKINPKVSFRNVSKQMQKKPKKIKRKRKNKKIIR